MPTHAPVAVLAREVRGMIVPEACVLRICRCGDLTVLGCVARVAGVACFEDGSAAAGVGTTAHDGPADFRCLVEPYDLDAWFVVHVPDTILPCAVISGQLNRVHQRQ